MPSVSKFKKIFKITFVGSLLFIIGFILISDFLVDQKSKLTFNTVSDVPDNEVGLLLGTSKFRTNGQINLYYKNRIDATTRLYKSGKINFVLISGDNGTKYYDEPSTMKKDLMAQGIPESKIFLDYAGFRTLDSVVRCREIFGQEKVTVISQQFHNERAIYLAKNFGIEAVGFNAQDVSSSYGFKTKVREFLARSKMMLDITFGVDPKFLGEKVEIR